MSKALRILFMGSPEAALPSLNALVQSEHELIGVVARPDRPAGRGQNLQACAVAARARELELPLFQPDSLITPPFIETMHTLAPDLAIVVAYGKILAKDILKSPRHGCWNVHFSLLPKYRGAAPVQWALINGEDTSGVSIIQLVEELDAGPVLKQAEQKIRSEDTTDSLQASLAIRGSDLLLSTLRDLLAKQLQAVPQNETQVSLAPSLKKSDGHIDWTLSAQEICNRIRGLNPWPGAFTYLPRQVEAAPTSRGKPSQGPSVDKVSLKIYSAQAFEGTVSEDSGTIEQADPREGFVVACGSGRLRIEEVQFPGKKRMTAADFLRGHPLQTELRLT